MLTVAGAGPGSVKLLTQEVLQAIRSADIVAAFPRIAEEIKTIRPDVISIKNIKETGEFARLQKNVLILASGDANFFGIGEYLRKNKIKTAGILCGISSVQYFASKLNIDIQETKTFSFHGREVNYTLLKKELECGRNFFLFTDKKNNPHTISVGLKNAGVHGKIYTGYNLSYENEKIEAYDIGAEFKVISDLNVVFIKNEKH